MKKYVILLAFGCLTTIPISSRSRTITPVYVSIQSLIDEKKLPKISKGGELDLSNKNINSLDGLQDVSNKKRIKFLYLNNNKLTNLPPNIFKEFTNLRWINLNDNNLRTLPPVDIFKHLKQLGTLSLMHNPLCDRLDDKDKKKFEKEIRKTARSCVVWF